MKAFIVSIPERLKGVSETLDVKASLCGRVWDVFNDDGVKQLFIFNVDGSLLITTNGDVEKSTWQYIPANKSIIISTSSGKTTMFHPVFVDSSVLALQKDGNDIEFYFMVDSLAAPRFPKRSVGEIEDYFSAVNYSLYQAECQAAKADAVEDECPLSTKVKNADSVPSASGEQKPTSQPARGEAKKPHLMLLFIILATAGVIALLSGAGDLINIISYCCRADVPRTHYSDFHSSISLDIAQIVGGLLLITWSLRKSKSR